MKKSGIGWTLIERTLSFTLSIRGSLWNNPKGNQSYIFIERTDAEAEAPVLWPPHRRADSLEKALMLGKIEGKRRRG